MKNLLWGIFAFAALAHAQGTVTDIDGNTYDYLTYGTQQWTVENADMETYRDGTPILQVTDEQWTNLSTGAWCYYGNDPTKGKLYNWYAVAGIHDNDPNTPNKEFAPEGWHVPSDNEWTTLEEHLIANGYNYDGTTTGNKIAKAMASTAGWNSSTVIGTPGNDFFTNDSSQFNSMPLGWRHGVLGNFDGINKNCNFWTSSISGIQNPDNASEYYSWVRTLKYNEINSLRYGNENRDGFSVRFVNDNNTCSEASINASSTELCAGESVDLSVDGLSASSAVNTQSHSFTSGSYTRIPYTPHLYNLPQSTIEFWYFQESSSEEFIIATEYFNTGWGFHVENNGGSPRFLEWRVSNGVRLGFDIPDRYEIPLNQWIHVAGVHDGSTAYLYADGNLIDSTPYTGQIGDSYEDIVINRHTWASGSSERLNGKIDELRMSNVARYTSNFIPPTYEFNNDLNTVALWHFNGNMQDESQYNTQSVTNGTNFSSNVPFGSYNFNSTDLVWSTGDTTENISVTPTETTEYWVDVTTNGVTCREYVTINVTSPQAPTGDAEQTFCTSSTVADLTATGDNIQWYDAATGGNLLDSTTVLTDGQMVYASQTVNGCESTDRLEVTVSIQEITITASATEVCAGESVDLSVISSFSTIDVEYFNWDDNEPNDTGTGNENVVHIQPSGKWNDTYCFNCSESYSTNAIFELNYEVSELGNLIFLGNYNSHSYFYANQSLTWPEANQMAESYNTYLLNINTAEENEFIVNSVNNLGLVLNAWLGMIQDENDELYSEPSGGWKWLNTNYLNPENYSYLWSTGDTTENITVTPTETTEYWVDVTTNGVTCRKYITINVTAPATTGDSEQTFCNSATVADLTATGDNIQWYDAATDGNLLDSSTPLTDGQIVYASQTVDGCESTDRLEVIISLQNITITPSATEVCAGESVDLTVSSGLTSGTTACNSAGLPANLQTGLVGYWPFCGNANDESGNGNNGTVNGATLITDQYGTPNSAYSFFSEDDYISLSENLVFTDADGFTVSIWMKKEDLTGYLQGYLFDISDGLSQNQWQQRIAIQTGTAEDGSQKAINFYGEGSEGLSWQCITTDVDEFENQWINIVGVVDMSSNAVKLYINGIEAANSNTSEGFDSISLGQGNSTSKILGRRSTLVPISNRFYGEMDDLAIWNRALTETEVQQLVNSSTYIWSTGDTTENISVTPTETTEYWVDVTTNGVTCREYVTINITAPAAPTGDLEQTFCNSATVADLTATGDNIQWYDVETGGNLLGTATALIDGQVLYASQIIEGCESTDRLEVSVSIQNITITASATEVCAGESVDLSVVGDVNSTYLWSTGESNFSGQGTLVDEYSLVANTVSQNTFSIIPGNIYRLEVSGTISLGGGAGNQRDVAYYIQSGSDGTVEGTPFDSECNLRIWTSLFCENPGLRPSPDIYDPTNHTYSYPFTSNSSSIEVGFWDSPLVDNGPDVVTFKLYELSNSESIITVNPTETTEYWVDVTTNSVTCREYITIDVTAPAAPTGNSVQGGCSDFTVGTNNNAFTGENLQWYAAPSGGTALPDSHLLADGTYYFISQTVDGCESSDRFEFLYLAPQPIITIDNSVICEGDIATVSVSSSPSLGSTTFLWNTGETSESITLSPTESSTFWVDQIYSSGGPENIQTVCRYFFGIIVDNAPEAPISGGDITECETNEAQNLVATASANAGESITWYDAATGSNVVANPSLGTAGTVTFFAEAINNNSGCASLTRIAVTLTINSVTTPTGDAVQSFCDNVNVSDLSAVGSNIQWYDADTGGNILDPSSALSDGQVLYASQTQNGCESITRLEVSVEIDVIPDPILITTELEFCLAREATLADLELDDQGFALEWYDSFNGGNMLPMDTLLEDGISYYTTLYDAVSGCESLMRLEVVPTVIPCEVIIYNALSLNGNGQNDYMVIENAEYFPDNSLEVYNRDGHLIYSQTQYGVDDNLFRGVANVGNIYGGGTIYNSSSGSNLPTGSYLYVFKYFNPYEQQQYALKGFLTINSN